MTLRFAVVPSCAARRQQPVQPASPQAARLWQITFLLAFTALALPCSGAQIVPLEGPWLAACLKVRHSSTLLRERPGQVLQEVSPHRAFDCVVAGPERTVLGFSGCDAVRFGAGGEEQRVWRLPDPVRSCLRLAEGAYLLLLGGRWENTELRQARAALWQPGQNALSYSQQVPEAWNPFELAGEGGDTLAAQQVLVAVRKTAPFDTVFRRRPFLFSFQAGACDLVPLWKGTSVAHPHLAAKLAHLDLGPGPQLCALEQLQDGRRMLGAYSFSGRMQMVAATPPSTLGNSLEVLRGAPGEADLLVCIVKAGAQWRAVAYGAGRATESGAVQCLQPRLQTKPCAALPIAWNVVRGGQGPGVLSLSKSGEVTFSALRAL